MICYNVRRVFNSLILLMLALVLNISSRQENVEFSTSMFKAGINL